MLAHPAASDWTAPGSAAAAAAAAARPGSKHPSVLVGIRPGPVAVFEFVKARDGLLAWAAGAGRPDGLSVLADARSTVCEADVRAVRCLPRFSAVSESDARMLPGFEVGGLPPVRDATLPGFEVAASVPSWLLAIFDQAGGATEARGRGAPWTLRLFVGALLSLPVELRNNAPHHMPLTTGQLQRWLLPGGWDRRPAAFERLCRALKDLDRLRVPVPIAGTSGISLRVVDALALPNAYDRGRGRVVLRVSIPGGAARGARVDWSRLTRYGAMSAPNYRAYLSVAAVLDYSARAGRALTPHVPAPVLDANGNPKRGKGGRIVRSKVATAPNPAARYVGWLSPDDVRQMVGLRADTRENRARGMRAVEYLADDGVMDIERRRDGSIRFFAPSPKA